MKWLPLVWGVVLSLPARGEVERFAVVLGNDTGNAEDGLLRYAEEDAGRFAAVLQEVGNVRPENLVLLRGQDAATVRRTLIAFNDRVRTQSGRQTALLVYYSGHADAGALHLGRSTLDLSELEQLVRGSSATFRLLVLDACRSGALTRVKGGRPIPPFDLRIDERIAGEGAVFLTSSSASEDSQESDALKGSFFTHGLVSALLGAADENGDGRVTLEEAYRYAYDATLRASSRTWAGLQHPTFQYEFRGQGDLVLSILLGREETRTWVQFPPGRAYLLFRDGPDGPVVAEVDAQSRVRSLSVRAGSYFVRGRGPDVLLEGNLQVFAGTTARVDDGALRRTAYARLVRKGEGARTLVQGPQISYRLRSALADDAGLCQGVTGGWALELRSVTVVPRVGFCRSGFDNGTLTARVDQVDAEVRITHAWDLAFASIELGLTLGGGLLHQTFETRGTAPTRDTATIQLTPTLAVTRELGERWYLLLEVGAATYLFRTQPDPVLTASEIRPSVAFRGALGLGFRL